MTTLIFQIYEDSPDYVRWTALIRNSSLRSPLHSPCKSSLQYHIVVMLVLMGNGLDSESPNLALCDISKMPETLPALPVTWFQHQWYENKIKFLNEAWNGRKFGSWRVIVKTKSGNARYSWKPRKSSHSVQSGKAKILTHNNPIL
jgi:hypothetical protein